ncbi:MAG TPA: hypothetical protein VGV59_13250 [Pyrinomonadaceae bacterium]|nr:hypothetical protein [Pyrinomonadaceae bacterium]
MNRTLHTFSTAAAASAALCGGRAPVRWRRVCARVAARRDAFERVARWGAEMYARPPGLSDTPLWGERLAELTARAPAQDASEDLRSSSRPAAARSFTDAGTEARTRRTPDNINRPAHHISGAQDFPPPRSRAFPQTDARHPHGRHHSLPAVPASELNDAPLAQAVAQPGLSKLLGRDGFNPSESVPLNESREALHELGELPREVGEELLHRLAGRHGSSPDAGQQKRARAARRSTDRQPPTHPQTPPDATRFPTRQTHRVAALLDAQSARHTGHAHLPNLSRARLRDLSSPARADEWRSLLSARVALSLRRAAGVSPDAHAQTGETLSAHQWSLPLFGETAPRELLARFADARTRVSAGRRPPTPQRERSAAQSSLPDASHDPAKDAHRDISTSPHRTHYNDAPDMPVHFRGIEVEQTPPPRNLQTVSALPGEAAAPVPAESLPSLLPPSFVGLPILPIALATAREGTRLEAEETEEDLDALAAKIKLILDEQARRHGIDV